MRHHKRKIIGILISIIVLILVIFMVCLRMFKTSDEKIVTNSKSQPTTVAAEPIDLGSGLKLIGLSEATGNFPEDGSDEFVEKMLSATFINEGEHTIQYASVQVRIGEETFSFAFSTLPAGKRIRVFEADKKSISETAGDVAAEAEYIAYFQEEPSLHEEELEFTVSDGVITVKNISETDIDKEIYVFYKSVSGDTYMGGITYRLRVPAGLAAGEKYQGNAVHAFENLTKVMFVTYGE